MRIAWLQVIVALLLGWWVGQRFSHLHPASSVSGA